ncbi:disease resistance protein RGA2-like [Ziziphus jujuba]|uniref:Disease resistance protein RGA2-like n=1 Tax=Ziziphus jujuba TaxID=326968 RepID=A0ABM4A2G8_ZIZJJ|nr:disease resistance protein RGA2-like [Ziziphus jujuba]
MAEIILSSVAEGILGMLGSFAAEEIILLWGVKDELEQLEDTVSTIKGVLLDAEKKQNHNNQVKVWLQRLQEVVLDADDLVDDLSYEALRKSLLPGNNNMVKQMEQLQQILREKINGKRYLLILDDIWNEEQEKWDYLKSLLLSGAEGSKVIVTTRKEIVARITGTMKAYGLKAMDKEKSWALFTKIALKQGLESNISSNILEIGKHIVDKCCGIPLAIRTIGGVLRLKNPETEWSSFMEKELSKIPQKEDDIISTLKLSYDHLPSSLKQCFVYYSLFPKDYEVDV